MIPYGKQQISQEDIDQVVSVLKSDFLTQGPLVPKFENKISQHCHVNYSCATNSATSALHIACLALNVSKGDIVWTSPISFVASANCALYCGAEIDFVDIDINTGNMCVLALEQKLVEAKLSNCLPKVIIPVHLAGQSCAMSDIHKLSQVYGFKIIEDASHAIGGTYNNHLIGSCHYSDITIFSFHPVKIITTAEGGVATTNDEILYQKMCLYRSHGVTRDENLLTEEIDPWCYQQLCLGFNYRMTELNAALGISQLDRLPLFIKQRNSIALKYDDLLKNIACTPLSKSKNANSANHLYIIKVDPNKRKAIFNQLKSKEIGVNVHYSPIHLQPYYQLLGFKEGNFPQAELFYSKIISLPLFPALKNNEQLYITETLAESLKALS